MSEFNLHAMLLLIQQTVSLIGVLVILSGVLLASFQYARFFVDKKLQRKDTVNQIRLHLGRILILGLEFIVAADLIGTTTTPDYYALGIVAIIVVIRTFLNYSLNKELVALRKE